MDRRIVYDSDLAASDRCPACGRRRAACTCGRPTPRPRAAADASQAPAVPRDGVIRIFRDRKQRRGKVVTVLTGVPGHPGAVEALGADLKRLCGSGGTVKGDVIEIQGDHRDRVAEHLAHVGYRVKLAGG
jgi:translation initiation factor 1